MMEISEEYSLICVVTAMANGLWHTTHCSASATSAVNVELHMEAVCTQATAQGGMTSSKGCGGQAYLALPSDKANAQC